MTGPQPPVRWRRDLQPLDPCYAVARGLRDSAVHVAHPSLRITFCRRTIDGGRQPGTDAPVGCRECRTMLAAVRDREARGLPPFCLHVTRPWGWRANRELVICLQPDNDTHRQYPDTYSSAGRWHDGAELAEDLDD